LGGVLSIVGATGSVTIQYILPGLFYFACTRGEDDGEDEEEEEEDEEEGLRDGAGAKGVGHVPHGSFAPAKRWTRRLAVALACYGFVVMFIALGVRLL
jgi:hypothetical protein